MIMSTARHHQLGICYTRDNTGREKHVVGAVDAGHAIKALLEQDHHGDTVFSIQVAALILLLLYSRVRLGSIVLPIPQVSDKWPSLSWEVSIVQYVNISEFLFIYH